METRIILEKSKAPNPALVRNLFSTQSELIQVVGANVVVTVISVGVGLLLARHFPAAIYGRLAYFVNLFAGFRLLAAFGLTSQVIIQISRSRGRGEAMEQHFFPLLLIRVLTTGAIVAVTATVGYALQDSIMTIAAIAAAFALLNDFGVGALQGLGKIRLVIFVLCLQSLVYALGAGIVIVLDLAIQAIFVSFTLSFALPMLLTAFLLSRAITHSIGKNFSLPNIPSLLKSAGGMYVLAICGTAFTSIVTLYLGWMQRFADAALVAIPLYLVFTPAALVHAATITVYFPRLVALHAKGEQDRILQQFRLYYSSVSAITILISSGLLFYPHVLLGLLYAERYQDSAPLLILVAPIAFLYTSQSVLTFTIAAQGRMIGAIPGAFSSVVILIAVIIVAAGRSDDLMWFAGTSSFATVVGLLWQSRVLGFKLCQSFIDTLKQVSVAGSLLSVGRLVVADVPNRIIPAIIVLALATLIYSIWVWFQISQPYLKDRE